MQCQFCQQEIEADAPVCEWCGRRQEMKPLPRKFGRSVEPKPTPAPQLPATRWCKVSAIVGQNGAFSMLHFWCFLP